MELAVRFAPTPSFLALDSVTFFPRFHDAACHKRSQIEYANTELEFKEMRYFLLVFTTALVYSGLNACFVMPK